MNFLKQKNLQSRREAEEEKLESLTRLNKALEDQISALKEKIEMFSKAAANAQAQYNNKLESLRLLNSGFNVLEEIGYERYVPTMESDSIEKEIFSTEFDIATLASKDELILYSRTYRIDNSEAKGKKF